MGVGHGPARGLRRRRPGARARRRRRRRLLADAGRPPRQHEPSRRARGRADRGRAAREADGRLPPWPSTSRIRPSRPARERADAARLVVLRPDRPPARAGADLQAFVAVRRRRRRRCRARGSSSRAGRATCPSSCCATASGSCGRSSTSAAIAGTRSSAGCGQRETLQCPYHAWTYGLDGSLRAAPRSDREPGFDAGDWSLLPVLVDTWGPLVFVNPDTAAAPLAETLGDLPRVVRERGLDPAELEFRGRSREWVIEANWKLVVENYLECYHCPVAHKSFSRLIDVDPDAYVLATDTLDVEPVRARQRPGRSRGTAATFRTCRTGRSARASSTTCGRTGRSTRSPARPTCASSCSSRTGRSARAPTSTASGLPGRPTR